jgi:coenzyme F420-dependent glucose-6-phosphate dehydrogenase
VIEYGYKLSSEEHSPRDLVDNARRAEEAGFSFAAISDHFHPWIDAQGHSPFVWPVIGAIAATTQRLKVLTGVTCPTVRMHPALVAQAAATSAAMMPGRFSLGLGSGENLNEHILGDHWPPVSVRLEMLEEAVGVIRSLWNGDLTTRYGRHYTVENARLFTLPDDDPPVLIAGSGDKSLDLAGRVGDGFIGLAPDEEMISKFAAAGGAGKPTYCEVNVCWAKTTADAVATTVEYWPVAGLKGQLMQELALPAHFEQAASVLSKEQITENVACGPDPEDHIESIRQFADAGYDHIWVHQIGPDQQGAIDFYADNVLPKL